LAALVEAIASTKPTAPSTSTSVGPTSPMTNSFKSIAAQVAL
jgi:hypothetical protein